MKTRHNKKRNTAFLFEALVKELTKSIVSKSEQKSRGIKKIIKKYFSSGSPLSEELDCYRALSEQELLDRYTAEKMIHRAKAKYDSLDKTKIFKAQSALIKELNKNIGSEVYQNFVPNYKSYATLAQIFGEKTPLKKRVLLEKKILDDLTGPRKETKKLKPVDSLVVDKFSKRFNEAYSGLLPEQRELLGRYVSSCGDDIADFKVYLVGELKRIRERVEKSFQLSEIQEDPQMTEGTKEVLKKIDSINVSNIGEKLIKSVLKMQKLVREYQDNAD
mgnify:CR=1 FL=1